MSNKPKVFRGVEQAWWLEAPTPLPPPHRPVMRDGRVVCLVCGNGYTTTIRCKGKEGNAGE